MGMFRKFVAVQALSGTTASVLALVVAGVITTSARAQATTPVQSAADQSTTDQTSSAQQSTTPNLPASGEAKSSADTSSIIVTGSRVRHDDDNFKNASPITVISKDLNVLDGSRSISDLLQAGSITSGTSQVNGGFLGFESQDGQGANTVGLRGLGASRTLILLNGRRLAPSGVGSELTAADLNVLPDALIDHIDIEKEGASSTYGSDAIAGVINIVTNQKFDGLEVDGYANAPLDTGGAGITKRLSLTAGKVFSRGHIEGSFEYRQQDGLKIEDRSQFQCPRDLLFNPATGAEVGSLNTNTGQLACFPYALGSGAGIASGYGIAQNFNTGAVNRLTYLNGDINNLGTVNGANRVAPNPIQELTTVETPIKTFTGYLSGSYELDILGDAEIYGEALFTRRESHQDSPYQFSIGSQLPTSAQHYAGSYAGTPLSAYGYGISPFFPSSVANQGYNLYNPLILLDHTLRDSQRVDFLRANGGLRGNLPFGDWRYDGNFQYSKTWSTDSRPEILTANLTNALTAVAAPAGTPASNITYATAGQVSAGSAFTCASNLDSAGAFIAGSACLPFNMYSAAALEGGHVPANVLNYLFAQDVDHTQYVESIAALNVDGSLFTLPAGQAKLALGVEHRYESLDDTPSIYAQTAALYNFESGGITKGNDKIDEAYGELDLPFFKNRPWLQDLELNASGRYTHYKSAGSAFTFHVKGDYAPTNFLLFRGNYGTSYRGPNLYELYLASQVGFLGGGSDPCSQFTSTYAANNQIYINCKAALTQVFGSSASGQALVNNFVNQGSIKETSEGGIGHLKPEHSTSFGFGTVINFPVDKGRFSLAIDYWNVTVRDEIQQLGTNILSSCYDATNFPNNSYCDLIGPRNGPTGTAYPGALASFNDPYINVAQQKASGVDFDLQYATPLGGGNFAFRVQATRNIHQYYQPFAGEADTDYNGTLGGQGQPGGPLWVGNLEANYNFLHGKVTFHYNLKYVGPQNSDSEYGGISTPFALGTGANALPAQSAVNTIFSVSSYFEHGFSIQWKLDKVTQLTVGCFNCTDSHPPMISADSLSDNQITRIGNYYNSSNYDYYGRSVYVNFAYKL